MQLTPRTLGVTIGGVVVLAGALALGLVLGTGGPSHPPEGSSAAGNGATALPPVLRPTTTTTRSTTTTTAPTTTTTAHPTTTTAAPTTTTHPTTTTTAHPTTTTAAPTTTTHPTTTTTAPTPPPLKPFARLTCRAEYGVRFCPGNGSSLRVPSFDGVPLDADVTLPATGHGPFPLLVLLHGLGQSKTAFESKSNDGNLDNVTMATKGWAVLNYTARGFGASCGTAASRAGTPACNKGWIHLADLRYEVRDTEYLAGLLVDEGIARPDFAVAGESYGAGQSLELAMLKNRAMLPNGHLVPLTSPKRHIPMTVAAVFAEWPWDDLASALVPNGSLSTTTNTKPSADIHPVGVVKESWLKLLYGVTASNYLAPPNVDPSANLTVWYHEIMAGEPYGTATENALKTLQAYKSAIGVPMPSGGPAPTAISAGWTDSLFPVSEALHYANRVTASGATNPMLMMFADIGHGWAQNKPADTAAVTSRGIKFLDAEVLRHSTPPTGVMALAMTCPSSAPSGAALSASSMSALRTGTVSLSGAAAQVVTSSGGDPATAAALNPAYTQKPLCNPLPKSTSTGTAVYFQPVGAKPVTLIGGAVIRAKLAVKGNYPEMVGRLWDVAPNGTRQIVAMGVYRPAVNQAAGTSATATASTDIKFELNPNDYTFAAGHTIELQLVGSNAPYFRKSNGTFKLTLTNLTASLPTR